MSDKLSALTLATSITAGDLIYFVDVSDTTDDPAGSSKAIAKSDIGLTLIEEIEQTGAGGDFDFTSIPQTYRRLYAKGYQRSTTAGTGGQEMRLHCNNVTTATNYASFGATTYNGSTSAFEVSRSYFGYLPTAGSNTGAYGTIDAVFEGYADTIKHICVNKNAAEVTGSIMSVGTYGISLINTTAITQITFSTSDGTASIGKIALYGEM